jgi:hypothetical protein
VGEIDLNCTGTPGGTAGVNLTVFLSVNITNRIAADGTIDATITADTGGAPVPGVLATANSAVFSNFSPVVSPSGKLNLRISNLRGAVNSSAGQTVQAFLTSGSAILFNTPSAIVATGATGLLASYSTSIICAGSPLPSTIGLSNLFAAGTAFASTRFTTGYPGALQPRGPTDDTGIRILVSYSGFPSSASLFVPDAIAGSDALVQTAGGDLGVPASGGQYAPGGAGSLLLFLVTGTDTNGAGGSIAPPPEYNPSGVSTFDSASQVPLQNGSGIVVYEVVDSNPLLQESAQFPTFLGVPAVTNGQTTIATEQLSLAPVSTVAIATATDPIPRFVATAPPPDCSALGDCGASYFPKLNVIAPTLQFTAQAGTGTQVQYVEVQNANGGAMLWAASVSYTSGSGWLTLAPTSGFGNGTIRIDVLPQNLSPGTYQAAVTINAGMAGTQVLPVSIDVNSGGANRALGRKPRGEP